MNQLDINKIQEELFAKLEQELATPAFESWIKPSKLSGKDTVLSSKPLSKKSYSTTFPLGRITPSPPLQTSVSPACRIKKQPKNKIAAKILLIFISSPF